MHKLDSCYNTNTFICSAPTNFIKNNQQPLMYPRHCMYQAAHALDTHKMEGVADSGATRHFLVPSTAYKNIQALSKPIPITIPNGEIISATHSCEVDYPQLPLTVRRGLIVPEMKQHSLISIKQLCQAGCTVTFKGKNCEVFYNGQHIMSGLEHPQKNFGCYHFQPIQTIYTSRKSISLLHLRSHSFGQI